MCEFRVKGRCDATLEECWRSGPATGESQGEVPQGNRMTASAIAIDARRSSGCKIFSSLGFTQALALVIAAVRIFCDGGRDTSSSR